MHIHGHHWRLTKEKILLTAGLTLIAAEFAASEFFNRPYHIEFLLAGLALCGVTITQWAAKSEDR